MSSANLRYWCHICNAEVQIYMAPDPTCQQCREQFIEELQSDDDPREFLTGSAVNVDGNASPEHEHSRLHIPESSAHLFSYNPSTGIFNNLGGNGQPQGEMGDNIFNFFSPTALATETQQGSNNEESNTHQQTREGNETAPLGALQNLLTSLLGQNQAQAGEGNEGNNQTRPTMFLGNMVDGSMRFQPVPAGTTMPGSMPTAGAGGEGGGGGNLENVLQFFSALTGGAFDAGMFGNMNDYVFSQTALDNIITQLMEQTGGSAPPPAPEQVIDSLKKRPLSELEKKQETDCAVCKDQFEPEETVIELPCDHIFHDDCIKPWLKLNGTCPVCRHSVLPDHEDTNSPESNTDDTHTHTDNTTSTDRQQQQQQSINTTESTTGDNSNSNAASAATAGFSWFGGGNGRNGLQFGFNSNRGQQGPGETTTTTTTTNSSPGNTTTTTTTTTQNTTQHGNEMDDNNLDLD